MLSNNDIADAPNLFSMLNEDNDDEFAPRMSELFNRPTIIHNNSNLMENRLS